MEPAFLVFWLFLFFVMPLTIVNTKWEIEFVPQRISPIEQNYLLLHPDCVCIRYEMDENLPKMNSQVRMSRTSLLMPEKEPFHFIYLVRPSSDTPTAMSAHLVKTCVGLMCKLLNTLYSYFCSCLYIHVSCLLQKIFCQPTQSRSQ